MLIDDLQVSVELNGKTAILDGAAFWDKEAKNLYLSTNHDRDDFKLEIPSVLARGLVNNQHVRELENFIGRLIGCSDYMIEKILDSRSNWALPKVEKEWIFSFLEVDEEPVPGDEHY
jgi:hypothetical protein